MPALEPGIQKENSGVGFVLFFFLSQKDQVRPAWHVMEWVGKAILPEEEETPSSVASHKHRKS